MLCPSYVWAINNLTWMLDCWLTFTRRASSPLFLSIPLSLCLLLCVVGVLFLRVLKSYRYVQPLWDQPAAVVSCCNIYIQPPAPPLGFWFSALVTFPSILHVFLPGVSFSPNMGCKNLIGLPTDLLMTAVHWGGKSVNGNSYSKHYTMYITKARPILLMSSFWLTLKSVISVISVIIC